MNSQVQTNASFPIQQDSGETRPYLPSFIDRFMGLVERLPTPYWLTFLGLLILHSAIVLALAWMDGWLPAYTFSPIVVLFPLWIWVPLAIMRHLNSISLEALSSFSPLLDIGEEALEHLKDEFTIMPSKSVIGSGVIWSMFYITWTYFSFEQVHASYGFGKLFTPVIVLQGLVTFSTGSVIYFHSLRQLRLVNRTVRMVKRVNLFQLDPAYAFARLTSRTGASWMILLSLTLLVYPIQLASVPLLAILVVQVALALAAFVLPLRFVNYRVVSEKRRLLSEVNQRVERTSKQLHRCLDEGETGEVGKLSSAMTGLKAERDIVTSIPTWPWREGTFTRFLSVVMLPILLVVVKIVIENWLGG
jgi:hypothetical protein